MNQEIRPVRFMVANGFSELRPPTVYGDVSPMAAFDGEPVNDTEFPFTEEIMLEFSNANGPERKSKRQVSRQGRKDLKAETGRRSRKFNRQDSRQDRKLDRQDSRKDRKSNAQQQRADIRNRRMNLKEKEQATQAEVAKNIGEQSPEEIALMNQLATQGETKTSMPPQTGMSKKLKIGLVVGSVVVIGIVVFAIVKSRKKSK